MSGELSASSSFAASLSMSTMASPSSLLSATSPLASSTSLSVQPWVVMTTSSATPTPTTNNKILNTSPVPSSAATYVSETDSLLSSTTSNSSSQSMPNFSVDVTTTPSIGNTSAQLPTPTPTPTPQNSLYLEPSASPTQTSTTNEQAQITSSPLVSVVMSTDQNIPEVLPTSVAASTGSDGALVTNTQIGTTSSGNSFFNNRGAVIGTFVVVAMLATAIFACLFVAWRRQRQRRTHDRVLRTITSSMDDSNQDLRERPDDQPTMTMINDDTVSSTPTNRSDTLLHSIGARAVLTANIFAPATGNTRNGTGLQYDSPFSDHFAIDRSQRGLTGWTKANSRIASPVPSSGTSTPSIYPPSLPPTEIESNVARSVVYPAPLTTPSIKPPPRPPRRRRPPPPPSSDLPEVAAMPFSPTTPVSFVNVVPQTATYTSDGFSPPTSVKDMGHKSLILSDLQLQIPPSSTSDHSQTDAQPCGTMTAAPVLDHPTNVQLERADTLFLRRTVRDLTIRTRFYN